MSLSKDASKPPDARGMTDERKLELARLVRLVEGTYDSDMLVGDGIGIELVVPDKHGGTAHIPLTENQIVLLVSQAADAVDAARNRLDAVQDYLFIVREEDEKGG